MSRWVSADLFIDSRTGRVVGTYPGGRVGLASLTVRRQAAKPIHVATDEADGLVLSGEITTANVTVLLPKSFVHTSS